MKDPHKEVSNQHSFRLRLRGTSAVVGSRGRALETFGATCRTIVARSTSALCIRLATFLALRVFCSLERTSTTFWATCLSMVSVATTLCVLARNSLRFLTSLGSGQCLFWLASTVVWSRLHALEVFGAKCWSGVVRPTSTLFVGLGTTSEITTALRIFSRHEFTSAIFCAACLTVVSVATTLCVRTRGSLRFVTIVGRHNRKCRYDCHNLHHVILSAC